MDEHPRVGILGPKILDPDKSIQMSCRRYPSVWNLMCSTFGLNKIFPQIGFFNGEEVTDFNYETIRKVDALSGCFLMVRREALQKVGLFDEQFFLYSEDVDWCRRFWEAGWEVMFYPEAEAIHYKGGSSANAPVEFSIEQERALFQYWKKYSNRISRIALIMTLLAHHAIRVLFNFFLLITRPSKRGFIISNLGKHLTCIKWLLTNQIQANF
jgi:GT2 family glycosyltransferase